MNLFLVVQSHCTCFIVFSVFAWVARFAWSWVRTLVLFNLNRFFICGDLVGSRLSWCDCRIKAYVRSRTSDLLLRVLFHSTRFIDFEFLDLLNLICLNWSDCREHRANCRWFILTLHLLTFLFLIVWLKGFKGLNVLRQFDSFISVFLLLFFDVIWIRCLIFESDAHGGLHWVASAIVWISWELFDRALLFAAFTALLS